MAEHVKNFWQKHPGVDFYSLFWLVLFLLLTQLGRLYLPLYIPAAIVLVYLLSRVEAEFGECPLFGAAPGHLPVVPPAQAGADAGSGVLLFQVPQLRPAHAGAPGPGDGPDHLPLLLLPF